MKHFLPLLFICLGGILSSVNAQEAMQHPKKYYQAPDGKLYTNKQTPVYLYISSQPGGKGEMIQLQSDSTKQFANPMYFDTEGFNSFRSPHAVDTATKEIHYPLTDVVFEVYADSWAPKTKLEYTCGKPYITATNAFLGKDCALAFSAWDKYAGVEAIYVSVDSAGYKVYEEPFTFSEEKDYDLNYYAVDHVGNVEKVHHRIYRVDLSAPRTTLRFEGGRHENIISGTTKIILHTVDSISGIKTLQYALDDKGYRAYVGTLNAAYLSEGEHTLRYYAEDHAGNKEEEQEFVFYVDKTPPILVDEIMGSSYMVGGKEYSSGRSKLKLTAMDNKAGVKEVKYSINQGEYQDYEKPFYLTTVSGAIAVRSYAVDYVGNKSVASEKSTRNRASYVDLTGPDISYEFIGKSFSTKGAVFVNKDTKTKIVAKDAEAGLKTVSYSVNGGEVRPYTEPFALTEAGEKEIQIYAYDHVDNSNRITLPLVVDNVGPEIYARFSVLPVGKKELDTTQVDLYPSHTVLFLSATDEQIAIDQIYYAVNGGEEKAYTGIIEGFKRGKVYTLQIKAYDKLGNFNTKSVSFATDNTGPEIMPRFSVQPVGTVAFDGDSVNVYPSHMSLFLSVDNAHVVYDKIYYSLNGGTKKLYQGIIDGFTPGAKISMYIKAYDRLGNETEKTLKFAIEGM